MSAQNTALSASDAIASQLLVDSTSALEAVAIANAAGAGKNFGEEGASGEAPSAAPAAPTEVAQDANASAPEAAAPAAEAADADAPATSADVDAASAAAAAAAAAAATATDTTTAHDAAQRTVDLDEIPPPPPPLESPNPKSVTFSNKNTVRRRTARAPPREPAHLKRIPIHKNVRSDLLAARAPLLAGSQDWDNYTPMAQAGAGPRLTLEPGKAGAQPKHLREKTLRLGKAPYKAKLSTDPNANLDSTFGVNDPQLSKESLDFGHPDDDPGFNDARPMVARDSVDPLDIVDNMSMEAQLRYYRAAFYESKRQTTALERRAGTELLRLEGHNDMLQSMTMAQKEYIGEILASNAALRQEMIDMEQSTRLDVQEMSTTQNAMRARVESLERLLAKQTDLHARELDASVAQFEALKAERLALARAIGSLATATLGGSNPAPEVVGEEAAEALAAGDEPIPRNAEAWAKFSYGRADAAGSPAKSKSLRGGRGIGGDGDRAVAALAAQIKRLHTGRESARSDLALSQSERDALTSALGTVDDDYSRVESAVVHLLGVATSLGAKMRIPALAPSQIDAKTLAGSLRVVSHVLEKAHGVVDEEEEEKAALQAKVVELEFYQKLHENLEQQASADADADADAGLTSAEPSAPTAVGGALLEEASA